MATAPKTITKRDGKFVPFDQEKIRSAGLPECLATRLEHGM